MCCSMLSARDVLRLEAPQRCNADFQPNELIYPDGCTARVTYDSNGRPSRLTEPIERSTSRFTPATVQDVDLLSLQSWEEIAESGDGKATTSWGAASNTFAAKTHGGRSVGVGSTISGGHPNSRVSTERPHRDTARL